MDATAGDGEPAAGIRASDAERDATLQRPSAASGDGRLTLEEFSQRMDRATTAKTRAELDRLVADLPTDAGAASSTIAQRGPGRPSWHISPIGGLSVSGPWRMERKVIVVSLIGGADLDLSQTQLAAPEVTLTKVSLLGGVSIGVPPGYPGRCVGLQPHRRHDRRHRARTRPGRADRPYPRVLIARRDAGLPCSVGRPARRPGRGVTDGLAVPAG
jgi:Domain of unknown function (DUF1707)